jgi:hypothetical protein
MIYIFLKDDLQIAHANKATPRNWSYSISELQHLTFLDVLANISSDQFLDLAAPLKDNPTEKIQFESLFRRKNNTVYPINVQITRSFFNKKEVHVVSPNVKR